MLVEITVFLCAILIYHFITKQSKPGKTRFPPGKGILILHSLHFIDAI